MRRIVPVVAVAAAALVVLAGCGGEGGGAGSGAAEVAPESVALFLTLDTEFEGEQWQRAEALVERFPAGRDALQEMLRELESDDVDFERDIKPAVGPEVAVVWLDLENDDEFVFLTQPRDEAKFRELLQKGDDPAVTAEIDDWTAVAETQEILDRFEEAREGDTLADLDDFEGATQDLPDDGLALLYMSGDALTGQLSADMAPEERAVLDCFVEGGSIPGFAVAASAEEGGVRFVAGGAQGDEDAESGEAALAEELPAGASSFISTHGLGEMLRKRIRCIADASQDAAEMIAQAELGLGVSLDEDLLPLFDGETAFAVYPAEGDVARGATAGMPAAVVATEVEDEERAREVADKIAARASAFVDGVDVQDVTVGETQAKRVTVPGGTSVFYAAFDGKLVFTTTEAGLAAVAGDADALGDDERYRDSRDAAGAPGETTGLVFLDLAGIVGEVGGLGAPIPPEVRENLEPIRSFLMWGDVDDDKFSLEAFLQID